MIGVKSIKLQMLVFAVLLGAASVLSLVLFDRSEEPLQGMLYEKSVENLAVIDLIENLEADIFNYHNALHLFLTSGDFKWKRYLDERKNQSLGSFKNLEDKMQTYFSAWVVNNDFVSTDPKTELRETLSQFQVGTSTDADFQRLFSLLRFNTVKYFDAANEAINQADLTMPLHSYEPDLVSELEFVNLIGAGINHLRSAFNHVFWDVSRNQNSRFYRQQRLFFWGLSGLWSLLFIFASVLAWQTVKLFRDHQMREESLVLLGTRDAATGLFNERSMVPLFAQELARAKRRGYALAVFTFRVEPCRKIRKDLGQVALDRLLHMISDTLRKACRVYDGLYRAGEDGFVMTCPETQPRALETLLVRFNKTLHKREFLLKGQQVKIIPIVKVGVAFYPEDGTAADSLIKIALTRLTKEYGTLKALIPQESEFVKEEPVMTDAASVEVVQPEPLVVAEGVLPELVLVAEQELITEPSLPEALPVEAVPERPPELVIPEEIRLSASDELVSLADVSAEPALIPELERAEIIDERPMSLAALLPPFEPEPVVAELQPRNPDRGLPNIEVIHANSEEIIMVDFDREKLDLAEQFRRKLRRQRQEKIAK
jgi:diguanylate cyclase (GGDEF)-like protein